MTTSHYTPGTLIKKIFLKLRYPKLFLLAISIYVGFLIYQNSPIFAFRPLLKELNYGGTFLGGIGLAHGFTLGPAVSILLINSPHQNIFLASLVALSGAIIGNYLTFFFLRITYTDEIERLANSTFYLFIRKKIGKLIPPFVRSHILPIFAGLINATPLPDEFSAALIQYSQNISYFTFISATFFFNIFGISLILLLGRI